MFKPTDYSKYFEQDITSINKDPLAPQCPFRLCIIGESGTGKTNMMINLLMKSLYFDKLYIFAKDYEEPMYNVLKRMLLKIQNTIAKKLDCDYELFKFSNTLSDLPDVNAMDRKTQKIIVFDDFILEKDQHLIEELFIRGRKKNVSIIYISQSYFKIPKIIRLNSNYFCLFWFDDKKQLRSICDTHSTSLDFKEFYNLFSEACSNSKRNYLVIDKKTEEPEMKVRNCWNGLLIK